MSTGRSDWWNQLGVFELGEQLAGKRGKKPAPTMANWKCPAESVVAVRFLIKRAIVVFNYRNRFLPFNVVCESRSHKSITESVEPPLKGAR